MEEKHIITFSKIAGYFGSATSIVSGFTVMEWGVIIGAIVGVAGFVSSNYWQRRRTKSEEKLRRVMEESLRAGASVTIDNGTACK